MPTAIRQPASEGGGLLAHEQVHEGEPVGRLADPAGHDRHDRDGDPRFVADRAGDPIVVVVGHHHHGHVLGGDHLDDPLAVGRARCDAGLALDVRRHREPEAIGEVDPAAVVVDDRAAPHRGCRREPPSKPVPQRRAADLPIQVAVELVSADQPVQQVPAQQRDQLLAEQGDVDPALQLRRAGGVGVGVARVDAAEAGGDVVGDDLHVERVEPDVGVAVGVQVALAAAQRVRPLLRRDPLGREHVARPAGAHVGVAGAVEQPLGPDLEVESDLDEQVGVAHRGHQRRGGGDVVGVLVGGAQRPHGDPVTADLLGRPGEVRRRRHHLQLGLRGRGDQDGEQRGGEGEQLHRFTQ